MGNKDSKPEPPRQHHHHHHHNNTTEQQQHQQFEARLLEAETNVWHSRYPTLAREVVRNVLITHPLPPQRISTLDRFVQQQQLHSTNQSNAVATTATAVPTRTTTTATTTTTPQQSQDQMVVTWMHLFPQLDPDLVRRAVVSAQHEGQIFEVLTRATQRADLEHWKSMFPDMPDEIILSVLMSTNNRGGGRSERVLERLLAISSGEVALSAAGVDGENHSGRNTGGGRSRDRGSRSARQVPNNSFAVAASTGNNNIYNSPSLSQPQYSQERFLYVPDQQDMDLEKMLIAQEEHRKQNGPTPPADFVKSQKKKEKKLLKKKKDRENHTKNVTEQKKHEKKAEKKAAEHHGGIVLRKIDPLDSSSSSSSSSSSNSTSCDDDDDDDSSSNSSSETKNKSGSFMITPDKRVNKYLDENHITNVHGLKVGHFEIDDFHKRFPLVSRNTVARVLSCYNTTADRDRVLGPGATTLKSTPPLHPSTYQKLGIHSCGNNSSPPTSAQKNSSRHRNDDDDDDDDSDGGEHFDLGPSHNNKNNKSAPNESFTQGSANKNTADNSPSPFKDPSQGTVELENNSKNTTSPGKTSTKVENSSFQASPEVKPQNERKNDDGNDDDPQIDHPNEMKKHPMHHNTSNDSSHQQHHHHHSHHQRKSRSRSNSALTPETECCVCLSNRITQMLVPCCHKISCAACAPLLVKKPCPICRTEVEGSFTFLENNQEENKE